MLKLYLTWIHFFLIFVGIPFFGWGVQQSWLLEQPKHEYQCDEQSEHQPELEHDCQGIASSTSCSQEVRPQEGLVGFQKEI